MNKRLWQPYFWVFLVVVLPRGGSCAQPPRPTTKEETIYRNGVKGYQTVGINTREVISCCWSADGFYYSYATAVITASTILVNNTPIAADSLVANANNSATVKNNLAPILTQIYKEAGYQNIATTSLDSIVYNFAAKTFDIRVTNYIQTRGSLSADLLDGKLKNATDTLWTAGTFSPLFGNKDKIVIKVDTVTTDLKGEDAPTTAQLIALVALIGAIPIIGILCWLGCRNRARYRQRQGMVIMPAVVAPYPPTYQAYPNNGGSVFMVPGNRPVVY